MESLIGKRFGLVVVIEQAESNKGNSRWICQCDCGKVTTVLIGNLKSPLFRSCGCWRKRRGKDSLIWQGIGDLSRTFFSRLKIQAKSRGLDFTLTLQQLSEMWDSQKGLCALSGVRLELGRDDDRSGTRTASLDRIDSSLGYVPGNVQWVHKHVNIMKHSLQESKFIEFCKLVTDYQKCPIS